jgi:NAD(P)H-nitrite reductase large subunit
MVIMSIGVKPNINLAAAAGVTTRRGIVTDATMVTSRPDIYAAGDVAETTDNLSGQPVVPAIWPVAVEEGQIAAANMAGLTERFTGSVAMNSVEVAGVPLVSVGDIEGIAGDTVLAAREGSSYKKIIIRGNVVRGILCLGNIRQAGILGGLVLRGEEVPIDNLLSPRLSYADLMTV